MKRTTLLLLALLTMVSVAFSQQSEEQKIRQLIDSETQYFAERNFEGWSSCWVHSSNALFTYTDSEEFNKLEGWEAIRTAIEETMAETESVDDLLLERNNYHIEAGEDIAWAWFDQRDNLEGQPIDKMETRVLKKVDGDWKILHVSVVEVSSYEE